MWIYICVCVYFLESILKFLKIKNIQKILLGNVKICLLDKPYPTIWLLGKQSCKNKNIGYVICIKICFKSQEQTIAKN